MVGQDEEEYIKKTPISSNRYEDSSLQSTTDLSHIGYVGRIQEGKTKGTAINSMDLTLVEEPIIVSNYQTKVKGLGGLLTYDYDKNCFQIIVKAAKFCKKEFNELYDYYHIAQEAQCYPD